MAARIYTVRRGWRHYYKDTGIYGILLLPPANLADKTSGSRQFHLFIRIARKSGNLCLERAAEAISLY
jgi:hypothetical protein